MSAFETVVSAIDARAAALAQLARKIHANPELRFEEKQASAWLADTVEQSGIAVERGVGGLPTAFRARVGRGGGPRVAILAEYDALPEIGHACGHNLIAGGAVGAFLGLASVAKDLGGEVLLLGTPGEEGGGGKIKLLEAGAFEGVDAAMMFHPLDRDLLSHSSLASEWLTFSFTGRPSHAAASPWDGRSALSAVIQTFNLIDSQRVHFRDGSRVRSATCSPGSVAPPPTTIPTWAPGPPTWATCRRRCRRSIRTLRFARAARRCATSTRSRHTPHPTRALPQCSMRHARWRSLRSASWATPIFALQCAPSSRAEASRRRAEDRG